MARRHNWRNVLLALGIALSSAACEKPDPLNTGKTALLAEQPDVAEKALKEALAADPGNVEATRLMADVHLLRGDFKKAEDALDAVWKKAGLDGDKKGLSQDQKRQRKFLQGQFLDVYTAWAEKIDGKKDAKLLEDVLKRALLRDRKNNRVNALLVDHYFGKSKALIEGGKKLEAAIALEEIALLRALPKQREDASKQAAALRLEVFKAGVDARLAGMVAQLTEQGRYRAADNMLIVTVEEEIDKKLRPKKEADRNAAVKQAMGKLPAAVLATIREVTGLDAGVPFGKKAPNGKLTTQDFVRGKCTLVFELPVAGATMLAFDAHEKHRLAKASASADGAKAAAPKADAPKADAPKADAPKADAPKAEAPKADAPKADAPKADAPKADAPKAATK